MNSVRVTFQTWTYRRAYCIILSRTLDTGMDRTMEWILPMKWFHCFILMWHWWWGTTPYISFRQYIILRAGIQSC